MPQLPCTCWVHLYPQANGSLRPHSLAHVTARYLTSDSFVGVAVRLWQLGIEMRPFFNKESLWVYPLFATVGGSFGYWLEGVEGRQLKMLAERKRILLEKRQRRAERDAADTVGLGQAEQGGILASTS